MHVISFNNHATSAIHGRKGAKLRIEIRDDVLFMRPTDRKAGPHVLSELQGRGKTVSIEINDKNLEKLGGAAVLKDSAQFGLVEDKYGWFSLVANPDQDGATTVTDAVATVTIKQDVEEAAPAE